MMKYQIAEPAVNERKHAYPAYVPDDEIDLIDLLRTLLAHKRLILSILMISVLAGTLLMFITPAKYQTTTRLEIGAYQNISSHEKPSLIEAPTAVVAKLKSGYIPKEIYKYEQQNEVALPEGIIKVSSPKNSNIIILQSLGRDQDAEKLSELQKLSVQSLLDDHIQRTNTLKEELQFKISEAELRLTELENEEMFQWILENEKNRIKLEKNNLSDIQDNIKTIKAETERLKFEEKLLKEQETILTEQLSKVISLLTNMDKQRESAAQLTSDSSSVMTLMLLDNERRHLYDRQAKITNMINLDLKEKASELMKTRQQYSLDLDRALRNEKLQADKVTQLESEIAIVKYQRNLNIQNQKQNIEALKARLTGIIPTSIIVGPVKSSANQSKGFVYFAAAVILGVFIALFLVGLLEIMRKLKEGQQTPERNLLTPVNQNIS